MSLSLAAGYPKPSSPVQFALKRVSHRKFSRFIRGPRIPFDPCLLAVAKHKKARRILADSSGCLANAKPTSLVVRQTITIETSPFNRYQKQN
jgi:hypothetical protein